MDAHNHDENWTHAMTRSFVLLFLLATFALPSLVAQQQSQTSSTGAAPSGREYRLQALYRAGIAQSYEFTESTLVERTHSDSAKKSYQRDVKYFITVRCLESLKGVVNVVVNLDSLTYSFTQGGLSVTYDSQKDITPKNFADLNSYMGPLNRSFELSYSPYAEVTKIGGEQITWIRDYLKENSVDMDSVLALIWNQSVADENLLQVGDLQKRIIPGLKVAVDSTWKHKLGLRVDGIRYDDVVRSKFESYSGGYYVIRTTDTCDVIKNQHVHVYNIPYITTIEDGQAALDQTLSLASTGIIQSLNQNINAWFRGRAANEVFTQRITTKNAWKLTGQYQW